MLASGTKECRRKGLFADGPYNLERGEVCKWVSKNEYQRTISSIMILVKLLFPVLWWGHLHNIVKQGRIYFCLTFSEGSVCGHIIVFLGALWGRAHNGWILWQRLLTSWWLGRQNTIQSRARTRWNPSSHQALTPTFHPVPTQGLTSFGWTGPSWSSHPLKQPVFPKCPSCLSIQSSDSHNPPSQLWVKVSWPDSRHLGRSFCLRTKDALNWDSF